MSRKIAREEAMKLIYQMEINKNETKDTLLNYFENNEELLGNDEKKYIEEIVSGVHDEIKLIDSYIEKYSKGWDISRIAKVDLAIMRLAIFEMINREDVPDAVSVNEAVDIAKKYSSSASPSFINGILASIKKELDAIKN